MLLAVYYDSSQKGQYKITFEFDTGTIMLVEFYQKIHRKVHIIKYLNSTLIRVCFWRLTKTAHRKFLFGTGKSMLVDVYQKSSQISSYHQIFEFDIDKSMLVDAYQDNSQKYSYIQLFEFDTGKSMLVEAYQDRSQKGQ